MIRWKDIDGFPGYQVSTNGKVRSYINNRHGVGDKVHVLKPIVNHNGYETVCLGRGNRRLVHRLVAAAYLPNPDDLPLVRHLDDNPRNNSYKNLAWGTQTDNMQDCVKHGRLCGDTSGAIAARKKPVVAIPKNGGAAIIFESMQEASRKLHVWPQHVSRVASGKLSQTGGYVFQYLSKGECSHESD